VRIWENCACKTIKNLDEPEMRYKTWLIGELAAKLGNEEVSQWAIRNDFYILELLLPR
jgi:hypothetical protein